MASGPSSGASEAVDSGPGANGSPYFLSRFQVSICIGVMTNSVGLAKSWALPWDLYCG